MQACDNSLSTHELKNGVLRSLDERRYEVTDAYRRSNNDGGHRHTTVVIVDPIEVICFGCTLPTIIRIYLSKKCKNKIIQVYTKE